MAKPIWLLHETVVAIHNRQIVEHGGLPGVRDDGALKSALARPQNKFAYEKPSLFELAAAYAYGLATSHPFSDGNKRTAYVVSFLFLRLNGFRVEAGHDDKYTTIVRLAAGELSEVDIAAWFKQHAVKIKS